MLQQLSRPDAYVFRMDTGDGSWVTLTPGSCCLVCPPFRLETIAMEYARVQTEITTPRCLGPEKASCITIQVRLVPDAGPVRNKGSVRPMIFMWKGSSVHSLPGCRWTAAENSLQHIILKILSAITTEAVKQWYLFGVGTAPDPTKHSASKRLAQRGPWAKTLNWHPESVLYVEWTHQHASGMNFLNPNVHSEVVLQYMVSATAPNRRRCDEAQLPGSKLSA